MSRRAFRTSIFQKQNGRLLRLHATKRRDERERELSVRAGEEEDESEGVGGDITQ